MNFLFLLFVLMFAFIVATLHCKVKYGGGVRQVINSICSIMVVMLAVICVITFSLICCFDYVAPLLKGMLSANAVERLREIIYFLFDTTSIFSAVKTLFVYGIMLFVLSCVVFGVTGICGLFFASLKKGACVGADDTSITFSDGLKSVKPFLAFSRYIS